MTLLYQKHLLIVDMLFKCDQNTNSISFYVLLPSDLKFGEIWV